MKIKLLKLFSLLFLSLVMISCDKEQLLEKSPKTGLSGDSYNSEQNLEAATFAIYDVLQWQAIGGNHIFPLLFQDIRADNMNSQFANFWAAGFTMDNLALMTPTNINVQLLWQKWYTGVNRANLVIEKTALLENWQTEGKQEQLIAEAKTLRAFCYFELLRMYGGVPLILEPIESTNDLPPLQRASVDAMYSQIDKDLTEALPNLPSKSATLLGRVTQGVARTLLAKSKLYQKDYPAAVKYCEEVMTSGEYDLEENFADNFRPDASNENGKESIFEIQYADGYTGAYFEQANTTAQGSASWQMMFSWVSGRWTSFSNMLPRGELKAIYDQAYDKRFDATFITVGTDLSEASPKLASTWGNPVSADMMSWLRSDIEDCNYARKYFISWELLDQLLEVSQSPKNEKIFRFAEVLLMHAEASAMGGGGDGQSSLDKIRIRAGLDPIPLTLENVKLERRRELATEGWNRYSDLVRWGDAASKLAYKNFKTNRDEVLPIPQAEIDAIGADVLKQNPGY